MLEERVFETLDFIYDSIERGEGVSDCTWFTRWDTRGFPLVVYPWFNRDELLKTIDLEADCSQWAIDLCDGAAWGDDDNLNTHGALDQPTFWRALIAMKRKDVRFIRFAQNKSTHHLIIAHHKRVVEMRKIGKWIFTTQPTKTYRTGDIDHLLDNVDKARVEWCEDMGHFDARTIARVPPELLPTQQGAHKQDPVFFQVVCQIGLIIMIPRLQKRLVRKAWEAFLLGTHKRLGRCSPIMLLCEDVLSLILDQIKTK